MRTMKASHTQSHGRRPIQEAFGSISVMIVWACLKTGSLRQSGSTAPHASATFPVESTPEPSSVTLGARSRAAGLDGGCAAIVHFFGLASSLGSGPANSKSSFVSTFAGSLVMTSFMGLGPAYKGRGTSTMSMLTTSFSPDTG